MKRASGSGTLRRAVLVLGLCVIAYAAGSGLRIYQERQQATEPSEPIQTTATPTRFPELAVALSRSGDRLLVTNRNDHGWTSCIMDLNAGVREGSFSSAIGDVRAGEQVSADLRVFARADGRRFDPASDRVRVVDLHCETPGGSAHFSGRL